MSDATDETANTAGGDEGTESDADASSSPPKKAPDEKTDLDKTRDALVEAAAVSSGLWITYLGVLLYLTIAVGSVTHRDLLLESSITLPFVSVKLPIMGFFVLGPGLFLIVHAYVLLHFAMLADKIVAFDELLGTPKITREAQATLRRRLPANVFVQFLAGPPKVRDGVIGLFLWLIALITLVVGPILLLLFFELQFLPYHDETISWWQRVAVGIDLGLLWLFWPRIALRKTDPALKGDVRFRIAHAIQNAGTIGIMLILTLGSLPLLLLIATFPGERLQQVWDDRLGEVPGRAWLIEGMPNALTGRPESLFSNVMVLPVGTRANVFDTRENVSFRGRDLRGAVLEHARLRDIDFSGAHLENANLANADLQKAQLSCASKLAMFGVEETVRPRQRETCAHLEGTDLSFAQLQGANLWYAQLQGAGLYGAHLQGANLSGDNVGRALLQGAYLENADLKGADLSMAYFQGANLSGAQLQGAQLQGANLQGADLSHAQLQGVDLSSSQLQGADLSSADLSSADLSHAGLQGADLSGAQLQGAILNDVSVWGTKISASDLNEAWVSNIKIERWDITKLSSTIDEILSTIPKGDPTGRLQNSTRKKARKRFESNLTKNSLLTQWDDKVSKIWRAAVNRGKLPEFDKIVDETWSTIGCDAEGAPYVMSNLTGRLSNLTDKGRAVAVHFQDKKCEGRKDLSAKDLASLKKLAAWPTSVGFGGRMPRPSPPPRQLSGRPPWRRPARRHRPRRHRSSGIRAIVASARSPHR